MNNFIEIFLAMVEGLKNTTLIFSITLIGSIPLGIFVAIGRLSKYQLIKQVLQIYIYIIRGTPLLLQIIFIYFGLSLGNIPIVLDRFTAVYIAFITNYAAYFGEIFRGGIVSIDKGQYEASQVLGISKVKTFLYIILPQVIKRTIASVANEIITLVKDTALVSIVAISELLLLAQIYANLYVSLTPFLIAGLLYLLITSILTLILQLIEKRFNYYQ